MRVVLIYTTQLKEALGRGREEVELSEPQTVGQLLTHMSGVHGQAFDEFIWKAPGEIRSSILLCLGDECIGRDLSTPLSDGDEVTLLSPVSGG